MLIFEKPDLSAILAGWAPLLYLSICSSGVGYTLQIIGQQYASNPSLASILMSMESVFAVIGVISATVPGIIIRIVIHAASAGFVILRGFSRACRYDYFPIGIFHVNAGTGLNLQIDLWISAPFDFPFQSRAERHVPK
jgi:hypothetical protein